MCLCLHCWKSFRPKQPILLPRFPPKYCQKPNSNDTLSKLLFVQNLEKAIELFGAQSINQDYAKQRFAILNNENYNKFFVKQSLQQMMNPGVAGMPGMQGQGQAPTPQGNPAQAGAKVGMGMRPNGQQMQPMMH